MRQHTAGFYLGLIGSIILGFAVLAGVWWGISSISGLGSRDGVVKATITGPGTATLDLATYPDAMVCHASAGAPQNTWVTYCAGDNSINNQIDLPPNSLITVNIKQYDSGTPLINDYFSQVRGTVGGNAMVDGMPFTSTSDVVAISKAVKGGHTFACDNQGCDPAHTFTIQSEPNSTNPIFISVPLLGVNSNAQANTNVAGNMYPMPNVITFQFRTGPAGMTYIWHCYDPCGDTAYGRNPPYGFSGPMWTLGYMAGTINVTNY